MSKIKINLDSLKSRREWKRHKVQADSSNVFRILPPFGENSNGYVFRKWQVIWGLYDPESGRARPFASSMTSEKRCPVTEYVGELKKRAEQMKSKLITAGNSEDSIRDMMAPLNKLISDLTPKTVYIYNAANQAGEVGLLELKATAHKKMKEKMSKYIQEYNMDPTSLNSDVDDSGVWFNIVRTGKGRDTEYDVLQAEIKARNAAGKLVSEADQTPLPPNIVENYTNLGYDLSGVYQVKSYEELQEILDANMADLIKECPEADLSNDLDETPAVPTKTVTAKPATSTVPAKKVSLKLDDEGDDEEVGYKPTGARKGATVSFDSGIDDDFLAEADAILNS